jgi:hypothetical protein
VLSFFQVLVREGALYRYGDVQMSESPKDDEAKFNETLKRMLGTPPKPHSETSGGKKSLTDAGQKKKPGALPAKKEHPEA